MQPPLFSSLLFRSACSGPIRNRERGTAWNGGGNIEGEEGEKQLPGERDILCLVITKSSLAIHLQKTVSSYDIFFSLLVFLLTEAAKLVFLESVYGGHNKKQTVLNSDLVSVAHCDKNCDAFDSRREEKQVANSTITTVTGGEPDRTFHYFRASRSGDQRFFNTSNSLIAGFWGLKLDICSVR